MYVYFVFLIRPCQYEIRELINFLVWGLLSISQNITQWKTDGSLRQSGALESKACPAQVIMYPFMSFVLS